MPFCKNCGKETKETDLYCMSCGAKANGEGGEPPVKTKKETEFLTDFANLLRGMAARPVDATKEFALKAKKETLILVTAVLALVQGLLGLWRIGQVMGQFEKSIITFLTQMNQLSSMLGDGLGNANDFSSMTSQLRDFKKMMTVPRGAIFGQGILVYLLGLVLLLGIMFLINVAVNKKKVDAKKLYAVTVACSIPFIYGEILAIIMCYASVKIAAFILILGMFVSMACLLIVVREDMLPQGQSALWTVVIAEALMIMVLSLVMGRFIKSDMTAAFSGAMTKFLKGSGL